MTVPIRVAGLVIVLAASSPALAADYSLLIGGGSNPGRTQFSIESNVIWFERIFQEAGFDQTITLFGSGGANSVEVNYLAEDTESSAYASLALVFDSVEKNRLRFRPSEVTNAAPRPLTQETLGSELDQLASSMGEDDSLLLTYSGHGGRGGSPGSNYLYLWHNTDMSAEEMQSHLLEADPGATVRFVLPQCFSGGFSAMPFQNLDFQEGLAKGPMMCGFTSVAENQLSEGCTASVNTDDYRDYASFLFGAVSGESRDGTPMRIQADTNGDTQVSLREAHLYTVGHVHSTDVPRSTSEEFLLAMEPWTQRWASYQSAGIDNEFTEVVQALAGDFDSVVGTREFLMEISRRLREHASTVAAAEQKKQATREQIKDLQRSLRSELLIVWPQLASPYTEAYQQLIQTKLDDIASWLAERQDFRRLRTLHQDYSEQVTELIDLQRELAGFHRIQRLLKLSRLHEYVIRKGDKQVRETYLALRSCEDWTLPGAVE